MEWEQQNREPSSTLKSDQIRSDQISNISLRETSLTSFLNSRNCKRIGGENREQAIKSMKEGKI
jgi:hypothetical protein